MSAENCSVNTRRQWFQLSHFILCCCYLYTSLVFLFVLLSSPLSPLETEFLRPLYTWLQATALFHADGEPPEGAPTLSSGCTSPALSPDFYGNKA